MLIYLLKKKTILSKNQKLITRLLLFCTIFTPIFYSVDIVLDSLVEKPWFFQKKTKKYCPKCRKTLFKRVFIFVAEL